MAGGQREHNYQHPKHALAGKWSSPLSKGHGAIVNTPKCIRSAPFQDSIQGYWNKERSPCLCQALPLYTLYWTAITAYFHTIKYASNCPKLAALLLNLFLRLWESMSQNTKEPSQLLVYTANLDNLFIMGLVWIFILHFEHIHED